jgi:hypothetical protein
MNGQYTQIVIIERIQNERRYKHSDKTSSI